jgi:hypothetical protein
MLHLQKNKNKKMEGKKATLKDFLKYAENEKNKHLPISERLLNILRSLNDISYVYGLPESYNITYISDDMFLSYCNVGKKTLAEFRELRANYLQFLAEGGEIYEVIERKEYYCLLRTDIIEAVESFGMEKEIDFVEAAIIEKFERDGIKIAVSD